MDFLPIKPSSTNKVNTAINLANDGGSKSNTGYFNKRGGSTNAETNEETTTDEVNLSASSSAEQDEEIEIEVLTFFEKFKNLLIFIKDFVLKIFGYKKIKVKNIYKDINSEVL